MNHKRKKAAVEKYSPLLEQNQQEEQIREAIAADDKGYTDEEVDEILSAIMDGSEPDEETTPHYQEWHVKITHNGKDFEAEKLKISRPRVIISEEQADILNKGVLYGGNNYAVMYYLPE